MFSQSYILGLLFIVLVALIWAASSVVAQYVYEKDSFDSPFLLTYIGTSLFTLWLPIQFSSKWFLPSPSSAFDASSQESDGLLRESAYRSVESAEMSSPDGDTTADTIQSLPSTNDNNHRHASTGGVEMLHLHAALQEAWTDDDHLRVALRIAPVWFFANWSYNASLLYTSITSSTVLASTSSLFTLLFAVLVKDETFSLLKLGGVLLGVSGGILTALHDASDRSRRLQQDDESSDALALLGDFLGLVSAVGYGAYAVQTRVYCPKDESLYSMQLLLGYIGLLNMVFLSPIAIYIILSSGSLEWFIVGWVVLKGLFDNFLSDYLWLRAVLLTNATVATVGLGLTIPLAFGSDLVMGTPDVLTPSSILGATTVLVGFVLVNIGNDEPDGTTTLTDDSPVELTTRTGSRIEDEEAEGTLADRTFD